MPVRKRKMPVKRTVSRPVATKWYSVLDRDTIAMIFIAYMVTLLVVAFKWQPYPAEIDIEAIVTNSRQFTPREVRLLKQIAREQDRRNAGYYNTLPTDDCCYK